MNTPPVQIHVHQCPDCAKLEVDGRTLGRADAERLQCDAAIAHTRRPQHHDHPAAGPPPGAGPGPPPLPGAGLRTHPLPRGPPRTARAAGGGNDPANLVTLCAACHRLWHERGFDAAGDTANAAIP